MGIYSNKLKVLFLILISALCTVGFNYLSVLSSGVVIYQGMKDSLHKYLNLIVTGNQNSFLLICFLIFTFISLLLYCRGKEVGNFVFKYRYWIAVILIIICTVFKLNGSSIGAWSNFYGLGNDNGLLFGQDRLIRSDEWAVSTPMALSQYANNFGYFSEYWRGSVTDMYISPGAAVLNWLQVFRPFQIGYLFFPAENGLAFAWSAKQVILLLVSFEFGLLITNNNKYLAFGFMILIGFSPAVEWWFSAGCLVEILIFGQIIVIAINKYCNSIEYKDKWIWAGVFAYSGVCFVLGIYPAWQVPFFYVFAIISLFYIINNKKVEKWSFKLLLPIIIACIFILINVVYFYLMSKDSIIAMMGASYPGKRVSALEQMWYLLFRYPGNLFLAIDETQLAPLNQSEAATFFSLFPAGVILGIISLKKRKDKLTKYLLIFTMVFCAYIIFGLPELIAKITLLSFSPTNRSAIAFDYLNIILLFRVLSLKLKIPFRLGLPLAIATGIVVACLSTVYYLNYLSKPLLFITSIILIILFLCIFLYSTKKLYRQLLIITICLVSIVAGFLVNPIRTGTGPLLNSSLALEIQTLSDADNGYWLIEGVYPAPIVNYFPANGAMTFNSTNVYPNLSTWKKLDKEGKYYEIYNRYAHVQVSLSTTEQTSFSLVQADVIMLTLNVSDLKEINIKYIYTPSSFTIDNEELELKEVWHNDSGKIYKVEYK